MSHLMNENIDNFAFLKDAKDLLTSNDISFFVEEEYKLTRVSMDGLCTFMGTVQDQKVGVIMTDFRSAGGSFASKNSQRMISFIRYLEAEKLPLVLILDSLGVRFMDGRAVFDDAFGVMPELFRFKQNNLFLCVAAGKALGIASLFFAQAHYRIAVQEAAQFNLTGPEVHKKFFGKTDDCFSKFASAEHQFEVNYLVHEMHNEVSPALRKCRNLIQLLSSEIKISSSSSFVLQDQEQGCPSLNGSYTDALRNLVAQLGDDRIELFEQRSAVVRVYIARFESQLVGVFLNPPGHPNNMLTVNAVEKYQSAIELFKALKLPVVSILDCPGGDPRRRESDADALMKMVRLTHEMIAYPYPKMGIINGRCFGGSGIFSFPKIFGGVTLLAVENSQMGVMHKSIIDEVLNGSPRLLARWKELEKKETTELTDLIEKGTIQKIITADSIGFEIMKFLMIYARKKTSKSLISEDWETKTVSKIV
jgi:acetyl-CoA carboxylase carboxyltransferase component